MPAAEVVERLRFLERASHQWSLYEVLSGPRAGTTVAGHHGLAGDGVGEPLPYAYLPPQRRQEADRRAEELLESLLEPGQLRSWRTVRRFSVPTPMGTVELGKLYDLRYRPESGGQPRSLCVVPAGWERGPQETPVADVWTNLLLLLRHDPEQFFRVANVRDEG